MLKEYQCSILYISNSSIFALNSMFQNVAVKIGQLLPRGGTYTCPPLCVHPPWAHTLLPRMVAPTLLLLCLVAVIASPAFSIRLETVRSAFLCVARETCQG